MLNYKIVIKTALLIQNSSLNSQEYTKNRDVGAKNNECL